MSDSISFRPGTAADSFAAMTVFRHTMTHQSRQWGLIAPSAPWPDAADLSTSWDRLGPLYEFLAANADQWWLAEQHGQVVGYARSFFYDGVRELTEFFVHPQAQEHGHGLDAARAHAKHSLEHCGQIAQVECVVRLGRRGEEVELNGLVDIDTGLHQRVS